MWGGKVTSITLLRHAESDWNLRRIVQGQRDEPRLTEAGLAQARAAAARLAGTFDLIVSSDLARAVQTATVVAAGGGVDIELDAALRERSFGSLEGGPLEMLAPASTGILDGRVVDELARPRGGESIAELHDRAAAGIERLGGIARGGARVLVVTHGGTIRAIRAHCAAAALRGLLWDRVDNCSVWEVALPSPEGAP